MLERNHVFTLLALLLFLENDRSPVALVAAGIYQQEFTNNNNLSYHVSLTIFHAIFHVNHVAETCHCSDIKCAVLITIPSPSRVVGF